MLPTILITCALVAITVAVHAIGLTVLLKGLMRPDTLLLAGFWPITWLLIRVAWSLILIHLIEILVWGLFYYWKDCMPNAEAAFYFSGVTYTTVGYGDLLLPEQWRMLGPVEGLAGILMCGLSTGFFFAVFSRIVKFRTGPA